MGSDGYSGRVVLWQMAVPVAAGFPLPHNSELYDDFEVRLIVC